METAKRTIAVEDTDYFKTRSLPEIIPVETYDAHAFLGAVSQDLPSRVSELEKAMAGYQLYLQHTLCHSSCKWPCPTRMRFSRRGERAPARFKMRKGAQIAEALAETYKQMNRPADVAGARQAEQAFLQAAGPAQPAS